MPRISTTAGPSNADVTKEVVVLTKLGKVDNSGKPHEWSNWKAS
jgi:hypothetical protein